MLITISILVLAYMIMGKDVQPLIDKLKSVNCRTAINSLLDKLRPWALKVGRATARPLLQCYYVLDDDKTTHLDRLLIYGAIIYTIMPIHMLPHTVYKVIGVLGDIAAIGYVYKKIKDKITPKINAKVEDKLNDWFGVEYEIIEG